MNYVLTLKAVKMFTLRLSSWHTVELFDFERFCNNYHPNILIISNVYMQMKVFLNLRSNWDPVDHYFIVLYFIIHFKPFLKLLYVICLQNKHSGHVELYIV